MEKGLHPAAVWSKKMIRQALIELMDKKDYHKITVSDIAIEAQIVRKTFYRHYKSKEAVLEDYIGLLFNQYIEIIKEKECTNVYESALIYFSFWQKHKVFLEILRKNDLLFYILKVYEQLIPKVQEAFTCNESMEEANKCYAQAYLVGGYWKMLCEWLERGGKETPEEMAEIYRAICKRISSNVCLPF